jgi:hypothetical protein
VCIGWNRSHSIGRIGRRMDGVLAKMYACCQVERGKRIGTSSVPTEDTLGSMGEVGVEILDCRRSLYHKDLTSTRREDSVPRSIGGHGERDAGCGTVDGELV